MSKKLAIYNEQNNEYFILGSNQKENIWKVYPLNLISFDDIMEDEDFNQENYELTECESSDEIEIEDIRIWKTNQGFFISEDEDGNRFYGDKDSLESFLLTEW